ncbi:MAG TPA: hypothetical protein V6D23_02150, partial [Candidatus Obscuribacterales bacterium]
MSNPISAFRSSPQVPQPIRNTGTPAARPTEGPSAARATAAQQGRQLDTQTQTELTSTAMSSRAGQRATELPPAQISANHNEHQKLVADLGGSSGGPVKAAPSQKTIKPAQAVNKMDLLIAKVDQSTTKNRNLYQQMQKLNLNSKQILNQAAIQKREPNAQERQQISNNTTEIIRRFKQRDGASPADAEILRMLDSSISDVTIHEQVLEKLGKTTTTTSGREIYSDDEQRSMPLSSGPVMIQNHVHVEDWASGHSDSQQGKHSTSHVSNVRTEAFSFPQGMHIEDSGAVVEAQAQGETRDQAILAALSAAALQINPNNVAHLQGDTTTQSRTSNLGTGTVETYNNANSLRSHGLAVLSSYG